MECQEWGVKDGGVESCFSGGQYHLVFSNMVMLFVIWSWFIVSAFGTSRHLQVKDVTKPKESVLQVIPADHGSHSRREKRDNCSPSHTQVNGGQSACQGERIFHDSFDGTSLNTQFWSHEVLMPSDPNYEFVVFDDNPQTLSVSNGQLLIKPLTFEDEFIRSGRLELNRCTGRQFTEECTKKARGHSILKPIQSARITTKNFFTFKYGKIVVRAKLPIGDWIVPEIWLEPKTRVYGSSYLSGRIRIAFARGNKDLISSSGNNIGNSQLSSGVIMGTPENIKGRMIIKELDEGWHTQFHNFTLIWEPENISFMVDGEDKDQLLPFGGGKLSKILGFDGSDVNHWEHGSTSAPFDKEFYISLGLSVGGVKDFSDNSVSGGHKKPWRNEAVKGMVHFWEDRKHWEQTWSDDKSLLQVEQVTVYAL